MENSDIRLDQLKGATLINENGDEFVIIDFYVEYNNMTEVIAKIMSVDDKNLIQGIYLCALNNWTIQPKV